MTRWWELFWTDDEVFISSLFMFPMFLLLLIAAIGTLFLVWAWVRHEITKIKREKEGN